LHEAVGALARTQRNVGTNIVLGVAAILLDLGYTPLQASAVTTFLNQNVFAANAFEAAQQREPVMQRLPEEQVAYVGPAPRVSPRALASRASVGHDLRETGVGRDMNTASHGHRIERDIDP
jgi:hypothetical protein